MTNEHVAQYYRLLHRHGADSQQIREFEETHKHDSPLVKRINLIKKQFIHQKRR